MLVRLPQALLWTALQHIGRAIAPRPIVPLLSGIHVRASGDELTLTASNHSMMLRYRMGGQHAEIERSGCIVVPARHWIEIVRHTAAGDTIVLEALDGWRLRMSAGRAVYHLNGMNPEGYPVMSQEDSQAATQLKLPNDRLRRAVQQVAFAAASSESRPVLTGVLCQLYDQRLRLTATDGVRLASRTIGLQLTDQIQVPPHPGEERNEPAANRIDGEPQAGWSAAPGSNAIAHVVIPSKHLSDYAKAAAAIQGTTTLTLNKHAVTLETNGFAMQSVLLEGAFPPIDKIMPSANDCSTSITVNTRRLLQALERSALLSGDGSVVRLLVQPDGVMTLNAYHAEIGDIQEEVDLLSVHGEALGIRCNARYMADLIGAVDCEEVLLRMSDRHSPIIVLPANGDNSLYALTPIRTREYTGPSREANHSTQVVAAKSGQ